MLDELCIYALTIGMTESEFWNNGMDSFYRHIKSFEKKEKNKIEELDYLAWRTGESVKSALETTAILSLMVDGKEAKKALKNVKYQEAPAYILIEKHKNKQKSKKESNKKYTEDEIKDERERLFNFINKIKPKK